MSIIKEGYTPGNHPPIVEQSAPTQDVFNKFKLGRLVKNRFVQSGVAGIALVPGVIGGVNFAHSAESNTVDSDSRVVNSQSISSADKLAEWDAQVLANRSKQQEFGAFFKGLEGKTRQQVKQIGDYIAGVEGFTPQESAAFVNSHPEILKAQRELGFFFKSLEGKTRQQVKQIGDYIAGVADKNSTGAPESDSKVEQSDTKLGTANPSEAPRAEISQTISTGITGIVDNRTVLENNSNTDAAGALMLPSNDYPEATSTPRGITLIPSPTGTMIFPTETSIPHGTVAPTETPTPRGITPIPSPTGTMVFPTEAVTPHQTIPTETPTPRGITPIPSPTGTMVFPTETSTPHLVKPTETPTFTNTPTETRTSTPTKTNTPTRTATATATETNTPTRTSTATATETNTPTATNTETSTPVKKATKTPTATYSPTQSPKPTRTPVIEIPKEMPNTGSGLTERDGRSYGAWIVAAVAAAAMAGMASYTARRLGVRAVRIDRGWAFWKTMDEEEEDNFLLRFMRGFRSKSEKKDNQKNHQ